MCHICPNCSHSSHLTEQRTQREIELLLKSPLAFLLKDLESDQVGLSPEHSGSRCRHLPAHKSE